PASGVGDPRFSASFGQARSGSMASGLAPCGNLPRGKTSCGRHLDPGHGVQQELLASVGMPHLVSNRFMRFRDSMIVFKPAGVDEHSTTLWLRPNRALSHKSLRQLAWGLAAVTLATALIGAEQGNVFAPLFALLEVAAMGWALTLVWRSGNK